MRRYPAAGIALLIETTVSFAAPSNLLNKTVTVSFTTTAQTVDGRGSGTRSVVRTLYISNAGRIFARTGRREGRDAETKDAAPDQTASTYRFAGNNLVGVLKFASGAAQLTVSFDSAGQSCTASVRGGRENGQAYRWKALNGEMRQGILTYSGESCSIKPGNAFGE
jgi:hypothetical protein